MLHTEKHYKRVPGSCYTDVVAMIAPLIFLLISACDLMFSNPSQNDFSDLTMLRARFSKSETTLSRIVSGW